MLHQLLTILGGVVALSLSLHGVTQEDWRAYDDSKPVTLAGVIRILESIDGVLVITIDVPSQGPLRTMSWKVTLDTPEALTKAGMPMEAFALGIPVEVQGLAHRLEQLSARAEQITIRRRTATLGRTRER